MQSDLLVEWFPQNLAVVGRSVEAVSVFHLVADGRINTLTNNKLMMLD